MKLLIAFLLFFSLNATAKISLFAAYGANYSSMSSVRLGINDWEIGQLNGFSFGAVKNFNLSQNYYANTGIGTSPYTAGLAIIAGAGYRYKFFSDFGLRIELFSLASTSGVTQASGLLGLSWNF